jgi:murein DD-endopeptidase MepM/ murein hydrolase activator NlpD
VSLISLFPSLEKDQIYPLDLSVSSSWLGQPSEFNDLDWFDFQLLKVQKRNKDKIIAGGYLEPRPLYTNSTYEKVGNHGPESRCLHLGVDFWVASNTSVHTFLAGEVVVSFDDAGDKKYGGLIILRHQEEGIEFFTLYGHLSTASVKKLKVGAQLKKGDRIGSVGNATENGNWSPHLHFQIMLSLLDYKNDFPGVAYNNQKQCWKSICPDPNLFFQVEELSISSIDQTKQILKSRKEYLGKGMSLQYQKPLHIVRGAGVYLIDKDGRAYLDTVNNVAHVGHEHSRVVDAGQKQMGLLNTNSRYLHKNITNLARKIEGNFT